jgi:nicotinate phosphoribosyltransferase
MNVIPVLNANPSATNQNFAASDLDEYSLTMAQTQWHDKRHEDKVTFELFVRRLPADYGFLLAAGLADCLDFLERFAFNEEELTVLAAQYAINDDPDSGRLYDPQFIEYLRRLRFTGEVYALKEGTVVGAAVPILRVTAPRIQAVLVEAALIATINQATSIATKGARITHSAHTRPVWDGSLRRNPGGVQSGVVAARAAYIAGFAGTATVRARVVQSWGEDGEQSCFENWMRRNPHRAVLLVDTYDTHRGIERALAASKATGIPIKAIRIDSGDLAATCNWARTRLDAAGAHTTAIMLSGDLDEYKIATLLEEKVPVDLFLVGTMLVNAGALGTVYKITAQSVVDSNLHYVMKKAIDKQTDPGTHRVWRDGNGRQIIALADEVVPDAQQIMYKVMVMGKIAGNQPDLESMRAFATGEIAALTNATIRLHKPEVITVVRTRALWELRAQLGDIEAQAQLLTMALSSGEHIAITEAEPVTVEGAKS